MSRLLILPFLIFAGCSTKNKQVAFSLNKFELPVVMQVGKIDTVKAYDVQNIQDFFPKLIGQYKFGDTINFTGEREKRNIPEEQYLWEVEGLYDYDSLSSDGFQIIPDYSKDLAFANWYDSEKKFLYYPVYVVNETLHTKIFYGKDSHGFAIQEAIDTGDYSLWHPIEAKGFDFCGNGTFRRKINSGEFLVFLFPKYTGKENTYLHIRFQIGENVFISKSFMGTINRNQFNVEKKSWVYNRLKDSKGLAANWLFYGGVLKEENKY